MLCGRRIPGHKNWRVSWDGELIDVYAINAPDQVIFADGDGFLLRFDGWQITSIEGVLPGDETLSLDVIDDQEEQSLILKYSGLRSKFGQQRCTRWALLNSSDVDTTSDLNLSAALRLRHGGGDTLTAIK